MRPTVTRHPSPDPRVRAEHRQGADHRTRRPPANVPVYPGPVRPHGDAARILALQRLVGNQAVAQLVTDLRPSATGRRVGQVPPRQAAPVLQRQAGQVMPGAYKSSFQLVDSPVGPAIRVPPGPLASVQFSISGAVEYEAIPAATAAANTSWSAGPAGDASGVAKWQAEVKHQFSQRASGWLEGWSPEAKIQGDAGTDGSYQFGMAGTLGRELAGFPVSFELGFHFVSMDGKGTPKFFVPYAVIPLPIPPLQYTNAAGHTFRLTSNASLKATAKPDYATIARYFSQACAKLVSAKVAAIGAPILVGAGLFAMVLGAHASGKLMARLVDEASAARTSYLDGFLAGATSGAEQSFDHPYQQAGYARAREWLRELRAATTADGLPVPELVLAEKVAEHAPSARSGAHAAITAFLHQWLIQEYWKGHTMRRLFGYRIDTIFQMLMESAGFGRPHPRATGHEPAEGLAIPGR